jgi:hypothetical protein
MGLSPAQFLASGQRASGEQSGKAQLLYKYSYIVYYCTIQEYFFMSKYEVVQYLKDGEECKEMLPDYPGFFITTNGRVWIRSKNRWASTSQEKTYHDKRRKNPPKNKRYYTRVNIGKYSTRIHILVGRYFLPEYKNGMFILHKDETLPYPQINYIDNLWIGTNRDNVKDMWEKCRRESNLGRRRVA